MTSYYKYRIRCTTDNQYEYWILSSSASVPTVCPTNTAHTIDSTQTSIVDTISENVTTIKEESTATGGNFQSKTLSMNAAANQVSSTTTWWPYPISAFAVEFAAEETHRGDLISMAIGEDTITGTITANVSAASAWTAQNYTVGQVVTYTHPTLGSRVYTCILNTVSNDIPTDTTYWKHGLGISVSQTVIDNTCAGKYIKLDDGVNADVVDKVVSVDITNDKIYVETNLTNSFLAATPTYIKQTTYIMKDFELGGPAITNIGGSKIGGTYIPKDTIIKLYYDNKAPSTAKDFVGRVEYLE